MGDGVVDNPWLFVDDGSTVHAWDEDLDEAPPSPGNLPEDQPGPNRVTIWVPTDETILNLGADYEGSPAAPAIDDGISGRTLEHVHFQVMGPVPERKEEPNDIGEVLAALFAPEDDPTAYNRGWVRLGDPMTSAKAAESGASQDTVVSFQPDFHNKWRGYSMLTAGGAVQESLFNHVIASNTGDLRLAGGRSVTLGSPGDVLIAVYQDEPMHDFTDNSGLEQDNFMKEGRGKIHRDVTQTMRAVSAAVGGFSGLAFSSWSIESGYNRTPLSGRPGWKPISPMDAIGTGLGYAAAIAPLVLLAADPAIDTPGGRLDLFSTGGVALTGESTVSVNGAFYVGVTSPAAVGVSAGGYLGLGSTGYSKYSAMLMAIGANFSLSIECQIGTMSLHAGDDIDIASKARIYMTSNETIQINSNDREIWLFGKTGFYLGAGGGAKKPPSTPFSEQSYEAGPGYGVFGNSTYVTMGKVKDASLLMMATVNLPLDQGVRLDEKALHLRHGPEATLNEIKMDSSALSIKRGKHEIRMTEADVTLDGKRILVG